MSLIASIPSPNTNSIEIGSFSLHAYGLFIALGVVAAVWLARKRWVARGGGKDDIVELATWSVPAGIIGARIYHVATDWELYSDSPGKIFSIWSGGLGIWGGIGLGVAVGLIVAKRKGLALGPLLDAVAPALALAQAIGRIGNYFNQELFGKPTTLPWGLEIDTINRPIEYLRHTTFHPTFLYEALWNIGLCLALVVIDKRKSFKPGTIFALYVAGYTFARFFVESIRIDPANQLLGLRINEWTSLLIFICAVSYLAIGRFRTKS